MNADDVAPISEPIILARVTLRKENVSFDKKKANVSGVAYGNRSRLRVSEVLWGLSIICSVVLLLVAMLQREWQYMRYLVLGLSPWFACYAILSLLKKRHPISASGTVRDEGLITRLDWLREHTKSGALREPTTAKGNLVWITHDGLYLDSGRYFGWSSFTSFRLAPFDNTILPREHGYQVELRLRTGSTCVAVTMALVTTLLVLSGCVLMLYTATVDFHLHGLRNDVLALYLAALLSITQLVYVLHEASSFLIHPSRSNKSLLATISDETITRSEFSSLLQSHLPREDSAN